jgi:hypothetical protein
LSIAVLEVALAGGGSPGLLFGGVEAPDYDIASAAPVVVPGCVEGAIAFGVGAGAEEGLEGWLELREEDEVVGPFVGGVISVCIRRLGVRLRGEVGWFPGDVAEATGHVVAEELRGVGVKLVRFVHVGGFLGGGLVDGGLAG